MTHLKENPYGGSYVKDRRSDSFTQIMRQGGTEEEASYKRIPVLAYNVLQRDTSCPTMVWVTEWRNASEEERASGRRRKS